MTPAALKVCDPRTAARSSDASMNSSRVLRRRRGEGDILPAATSSPEPMWRTAPTKSGSRPQLVDVIVVDEQLRRPIGRPVLTIAIDICTRMVAGSTSLDPPSSASVDFACCTLLTKTPGSPSEYRPLLALAGLPSILHCDNGAEFHFTPCRLRAANTA